MKLRLALVVMVTACTERRAPPIEAAPTPAVAPAVVATAPVPIETDVTFLVVSDTHVGHVPARDLDRLVARANAIVGRPYPREVGGVVGVPRGLVVTGDLTEWGREEQWSRFVTQFGGDGGTGDPHTLHVPLFEMAGNHDKVELGPWIEQRIAERHGGPVYAWDWDGVHLVALGELPDDAALDFLERDLARVPRATPLFVFFHRALAGPWSNDGFEPRLKERLARLLADRDVAGIFHGHHHATGHYVWNGIDVWKPGAVKDGAHTFAVVHVTRGRRAVVSFDWESERWGPSHVRPR